MALITTWTANTENLGNTDTSSNITAGAYIYFHQYTTTNGGVITKFMAYIGSTAPTKLKCAIYTDSAGSPDALVANTSSVELSGFSTSSYNELTVSGGATLSGSTTYWVSHWGDFGGNYQGPRVASGGATRAYLSQAYDGWPGSAAGSTGDGATASSMYAVLGVTNTWKATLTTQPGNVWFDGLQGTLQASAAACTGAREWFWDSNVLYVYSASDPDSAYVNPGISTYNEGNASKTGANW